MARPSKVEWKAQGKLEFTDVPVKIDGEDAGAARKFRIGKTDGKTNVLTLDEAVKALGFKNPSNAVKALILGKNKMNATKVRAQAKLDAAD